MGLTVRVHKAGKKITERFLRKKLLECHSLDLIFIFNSRVINPFPFSPALFFCVFK